MLLASLPFNFLLYFPYGEKSRLIFRLYCNLKQQSHQFFLVRA